LNSLSLPLKIIPHATLGMRAIGCRRLGYTFHLTQRKGFLLWEQ